MLSQYKLTETERQAFCDLVAWFPQQVGDEPSYSRLDGVCESTRILPAVIAHQIKSREFRKYASQLTGLTKAVNTLLNRSGKPALLIEGLPVTDDNAATLITVLSLLGDAALVEYEDFGTLVDVIDNKGRGEARPTGGNNLRFDLHTDLSFYPNPPALVNFVMVRPAQQGGESLFCDMRQVVQELSSKTLQALKKDFKFPAPPRFPDLMPLYAPILVYDEDNKLKSVRYRRDGLIALQEAQVEALQEFELTTHKHACKLQLQSGQGVIFDNRIVLHGRREFTDAADKKGQRHAVRTYGGSCLGLI